MVYVTAFILEKIYRGISASSSCPFFAPVASFVRQDKNRDQIAHELTAPGPGLGVWRGRSGSAAEQNPAAKSSIDGSNNNG